MKNYKNYEKRYIGSSDIARLTLMGLIDNDIEYKCLSFGQDDNYTAYICDRYAEIGSHYKLVATFKNWLTIYDDDSKTVDFRADEIRVYRACEMGCIIQLINKGIVIRDREAGNIICRVVSIKEAEQLIAEYEETDKKDGTYEKDFYEIYDEREE